MCLLLWDSRIQSLKPLRQTSGRVTQSEKAEIFASLSSTVSASLCLSVCLNIVAQRGRGGSGRGDVWRRQTEAAWVNQTETKPAVRGSGSGGGEGGKTSKQQCVGDGNCGLAGHCLHQTWLEYYNVYRGCFKAVQSTQRTGFHHIKATAKPYNVLMYTDLQFVFSVLRQIWGSSIWLIEVLITKITTRACLLLSCLRVACLLDKLHAGLERLNQRY